jgi:hypothetical protein|tara:strand:- start:1175 stop:2029 length:855 start_codon:yes stop_codon:yes gene_type:complete
MIIVDYGGLSASTVAINKENDENMIRHMIINSLRLYRNAYKENFGELVIACDSKNNWRKNYYPQYKANRKKARDKSGLDWVEAFRIINKIRDELKEHFPYKVIEVEGCEADDIIGTLCKNTQEFGQYEDVMIVSADKDFLQLQRYKNVRQYSPLLKKEYREETPLVGLTEKILTGDAGDGVPNVLSHDNVFVEGERQRPLSRKKKDDMINQLNHADSGYQHSEWYRNYQRNRKLIDLEYTPEELQSEILEQFNNQDKWAKRGEVLPYLINNRMKLMIESVEELI